MGRAISEEEIEKVIMTHDIDGSKQLDFNEFKLVFGSEEDIEKAKQTKNAEPTKKKEPVRRTSLLLNMPVLPEKKDKESD